MPIYEYYSPDSNKIYSFYAKTIAQGQTIPACPDNPKFRMVKVLSQFAIGAKSQSPAPDKATSGDQTPEGGAPGPDEARMDAAMAHLEKEMAGVDENDPRAMGRVMRRMSELTGERLDGEAEEIVRKLEEGADPEDLEEAMGGENEGAGGGFGGSSPVRDQNLYDY